MSDEDKGQVAKPEYWIECGGPENVAQPGSGVVIMGPANHTETQAETAIVGGHENCAAPADYLILKLML